MSKRFKKDEDVWVRARFSHKSMLSAGRVYVTIADYGGSGPIGVSINNVIKLPTVRTPREGKPEKKAKLFAWSPPKAKGCPIDRLIREEAKACDKINKPAKKKKAKKVRGNT